MHYLGIPTTRAAACVTSDSTVLRDPLYDGNSIAERCTVVTRVAENFFRFGSFEIFKKDGERSGPSAGNTDLQKAFLEHVQSYYSDSAKQDVGEFYEEVVRKTALLVARWQAVGFVHGVLNTDNMSIMALTIDYGPFAFMEFYDPDFIPNGSDGAGRYRYSRQPQICKWNLRQLGVALRPFLSPEHAEDALSQFDSVFQDVYDKLLIDKFGFGFNTGNSMGEVSLSKADRELIDDFFSTLETTSADFAYAFNALTEFATDLADADVDTVDLNVGAPTARSSTAEGDLAEEKLVGRLVEISATPAHLSELIRRRARISRLQMAPAQILEIWEMLDDPAKVSEMFYGASVEDIRREIAGEKSKLDWLMQAGQRLQDLQVLTEEEKKKEDYQRWAPWVAKYRVRLAEQRSRDSGSASVSGFPSFSESNDSNVSSESDVPAGTYRERLQRMRSSNPTFILRNWVCVCHLNLLLLFTLNVSHFVSFHFTNLNEFAIIQPHKTSTIDRLRKRL